MLSHSQCVYAAMLSVSCILAEFTDDMPQYTARPDDYDGVFVGMYSAFNSGFR